MAALSAGVAELSRSYNQHQRAPALTPAVHGARLGFFFPRDVPKSAAAIQELLEHLPDRPLRILDLGCGLGATSVGVILALRERGRRHPIDVLAIDMDPTALALIPPLFAHLPHCTVRTSTGDATTANEPGPWDLILLGQVLCEVDPWILGDERSKRLATWIRSLDQTLAPDGSLVIVEPALKTPTRQLHALRDELVHQELIPFAPCLHRNACPMLQRDNDWCHEHRPIDLPTWLEPIARAAGLRWEGLTFSYLILRKDRATRTGRVRVVSEPLVSKGRLDFIFCGQFPSGGDAKKIGRLDRHRSPENAHWDTLRRGDVLAIELDSQRIDPQMCIPAPISR